MKTTEQLSGELDAAVAADLFGDGKLTEALAAYQALLTRPGAPPKIHYNVAVVLRAMFRHDEALPHLVAFIRSEPTHFQAWTNAGDSLRMMANHLGATVMFREALKLAASLDKRYQAQAHHNLSRSLWIVGPFDEAVVHATAARNLEPHNPKYVHCLGEMQLASEDFKEGWPNYDARQIAAVAEEDPGIVDRSIIDTYEHVKVNYAAMLPREDLTTEHDRPIVFL